MKIYCVGPDELSDYDLDNLGESVYDWFIYYYEDCGYDGNGEAVGLTKDGKIHVYDLSHCSCYGPLDDGWDGPYNGVEITIEELLRKKDHVLDHDYHENIVSKAKELL